MSCFSLEITYFKFFNKSSNLLVYYFTFYPVLIDRLNVYILRQSELSQPSLSKTRFIVTFMDLRHSNSRFPWHTFLSEVNYFNQGYPYTRSWRLWWTVHVSLPFYFWPLFITLDLMRQPRPPISIRSPLLIIPETPLPNLYLCSHIWV